MASVVLALCVVGVSSAIVSSQAQSSAQQEASVATTLARQLMEEIVSRPIVLSGGTTGNAGWPGDTNKAHYDTVDDYKGYADIVDASTQLGRNASQPANSATPGISVDTANTPISSLALHQYRRSVSVTFPTSIYGTTVTSGEFAVVTVTVVGQTGVKIQLSRLLARSNVVR